MGKRGPPLYILVFLQRRNTPMAMTSTRGISRRVVMMATDMLCAFCLTTLSIFCFSSSFWGGSAVFCEAASGGCAGSSCHGFRWVWTNVSVSGKEEECSYKPKNDTWGCWGLSARRQNRECHFEHCTGALSCPITRMQWVTWPSWSFMILFLWVHAHLVWIEWGIY